MSIVILPIVPYLGVILGLLVVWRHHQIQVAAGNRLALGLFNRSGMRFFLYATPDIEQICPVCRAVHGTVFHPHIVQTKTFTPLETPCKSPEVCAGVLIGFYGGWLEAGDIIRRLSSTKPDGRLKLSQEELHKLVKGWCENYAGAVLDRGGVHMLRALLFERSNPIQSIVNYGGVVDQPAETRHGSLLVPAYIRLTSLLAQRGDLKRAIQVVDHFEKRYYRREPGPYYPTAKQRRVMAVMKPYLLSMSDPSNKQVKPANAAS